MDYLVDNKMLKINQNNKYLLEVISLRDIKTAEAIIVELSATGL